MKKIIYIFTAVILAMLGLYACMEDSKITYSGPTMVYFPEEGSTFYIQDNGQPQIYNVRLGATVAADKDRTVNLSITSTDAVKGTQYNYTSSDVVIKAGEYVVDLPIEGLYSGFAAGNVDTLDIKITGGDIPGADFKQSFQLVLRKYCPVVLEDLYGWYYADGPRIFTGTTPYDVMVSPNPNGGDTLVIRNFYRSYDLYSNYPSTGPYTDVKIVLDYSDPANFTAVIANERQDMFRYVSPPFNTNYGQVWVQQTAAKGTFSSCDKTITLKFDIRVSAGSLAAGATCNMVWNAPLQ
jgi:hypothetical protein